MKTFVATYFLLPTGILGTTVILIEYKLVFISHPSQVLALSIIEQPGSTLVISRVTFWIQARFSDAGFVTGLRRGARSANLQTHFERAPTDREEREAADKKGEERTTDIQPTLMTFMRSFPRARDIGLALKFS